MRRLCAVAVAVALGACSVKTPAPRFQASPDAPAAPAAARLEERAPQEAATTWRIGLGDTVRVAGGELEVTFERVLADSRCPRGETCVWEGDAVVLLRLRAGTGTAEAELHTAARATRAAGFAGWHVELLDLEPAPTAGKPAPPGAPVVALRIGRGPAPGAAETAIQ